MDNVQISKWYDIQIAAPHQQPREDGWGIRERDDLPAYKEICARNFQLGDYKPEDVNISASGPGWASAIVGGSDENSYAGFRDFPDYRQAQIKTHRHAEIAEIGRMDGVTVNEVPPSNFYMISGILWNEDEAKESMRLQSGNDGKRDDAYMAELHRKFDEEIWPRVKPEILRMVQQSDSAELLYDIDSARATVIFIKTNSDALIESIRRLDSHVTVEESPPSTTLEDIARIAKEWSINEPYTPKVKVSGGKPAELNS